MLILKNLWRDERVQKFFGGIISDDRIKKKVVELQNHWDQYQFGRCAVFDKVAKKIIGLCGLHHSEDFKDSIELSYIFFPEFWKKRFAREAAKACIDYGFHTLKLNQIIAITQEANIQSCQLLQTIGMEYIRSFELFNAQQCMYTIDNKLSCISTSQFLLMGFADESGVICLITVDSKVPNGQKMH